MVTRLEAYAMKAKSLICSALQTSAQFADNFAPVLNPLYLPARIAEVGHGLLCNKDPGTYSYPGSAVTPFTGGQCNVNYLVVYTASQTSANGQFTTNSNGSVTVLGPIEGIGWEVAPNGDNALYVYHNGTKTARAQGFRNTDYPNVVAAITSVTRSDGQPDNCGNPPTDDPLPPGPVTFPNEQTDYTDDNGNPITETRDWTFYPPYIDISDNLSIDIDIGDLNLTVNLYPDFNVKPRLPKPELEDGPIEGNQNIPDDPEEELEQKTNRKYIGVRIYARKLSSARVTEIFQEDVPDLMVPRVANVYFRFDFKTGNSWSPAIECTNLRAYIPVVGVIPASDIKVEFAPGFTGYFIKVPEPKEPVAN